MAIELFKHNLDAYNSAVEMLDETGKACVVHPTGTGKSFIGFKLCEDHPENRVLWLSPSEYIYNTQIENLKKVTDAIPQNITFCTYARLMRMSDVEIGELKPVFIILDEFHRCGAEMWGQGVDRLLAIYPEAKLLGLSATAIRYLDNQRNMADELFDGNIASEMTLGEAIVRGIIKAPKYVLSVYKYQSEYRRLQTRIDHAKSAAVRDKAQDILEALRRTLEKADGLEVIFDRHIENRSGKYIVFCSSFEHMTEMQSHVGEWFGRIDSSPHIYSVYSDDPDASLEFAGFKKDDSSHLKLLFAIDALNEGIHVDDVSGVILFRPTVSPTVYKQQIGRALSASGSSVPVIFDVVNNIEGLCSIDTIQNEMETAISYYRSLGLDDDIITDRFTVTDEVGAVRELFDRLNDTLSASWDEMFRYAEEYCRAHGNLEVERRYKTPEGYSLGSWIQTQRKVRKGEQYGRLSDDQISRLDSIGMVWDSVRDQAWARYYQAAREYSEKYGDLKPPADYIADSGVRLGAWTANIRNYYRNGAQSSYLTKERISMLNALGMVWDVGDEQWEKYFSECENYYRQYGNLDVPVRYVSNSLRIGVWLDNLRGVRSGKRSGTELTEEKIRRLDAIGMVWSGKRASRWERGCAAAERYYKDHGSLDVQYDYTADDGFRLGDWITNQRENKAHLSEERIRRLDDIGMVWEKSDLWETRYALVRKYYQEHGNINIPADYKSDGVWLNKWLNEQKQAYRGNRSFSLTGEQIDKLEALGMTWRDYKDNVWLDRYAEAKQYYAAHGTMDGIPIPLRRWFTVQRKNRKEGKLTKEQIELLDSMQYDIKVG